MLAFAPTDPLALLKASACIRYAGDSEVAQEFASKRLIEDTGLGWEFTSFAEHIMQTSNFSAIMRDRIKNLSEESSRSADAALWLYTLIKGGEGDYWSGLRTSGGLNEVLHVLSCGINAKQSRTPSDDSWKTFAGTFVDDNNETGLEGEATCTCGMVDRLVVRAYSPSLSSLIRSLTDPDAFMESIVTVSSPDY